MFSSGQLELHSYHQRLFPSKYVLYAWQVMHLSFNVIDVVRAKLLPCQPVLPCFSDTDHCDKKYKAADMLQHF